MGMHTKETIRDTLLTANEAGGISYKCNVIFKEDDKGFIAYAISQDEHDENEYHINHRYFIHPSDKYEGLLMMKPIDNCLASWIHISAVPGAIFAILYT